MSSLWLYETRINVSYSCSKLPETKQVYRRQNHEQRKKKTNPLMWRIPYKETQSHNIAFVESRMMGNYHVRFGKEYACLGRDIHHLVHFILEVACSKLHFTGNLAY
jgi:hypothetical protein